MAERGIIYGRASRDPKDLKRSVDDQIAECQQWADAEGISVVEVFRDDGYSASTYATRERGSFEDALRFIQSHKADILIVWEASRAARDLEAFVRLRDACAEAGVAYSYKGRRYDLSQAGDRFTTGLDALLAERDAGDIRERNLRTVRRNADKGTPHGRLPYGYQRVYDARTGALIDQTPYVQADGSGAPVLGADGKLIPVLPDSEISMVLSPEAQVLADSAAALLADGTLKAVCRDLNARGVPTSRKPRKKTLAEDPAGVVTQWESETLRQLLRNPTIAGRRVHRGEDIGEASWAPIIDYGTWLQLHALFSDPARLTVPTPRGPAPRHLLSGIATCGECSGRMKAATNMNRIARAYTCRVDGCGRVTVTAQRVDDMINAFLTQYFSRPDFRDVLAAAQSRRDEAVEHGPDVGALIAAKEAERDEADALRREGVMNLRAYAVETGRIDDEIEELRTRQVGAVTSGAVRRLLSAETLVNGWEAADLMDKREIVRMLLSIRVDRAMKKGRVFDTNRVKMILART